MNPADFVAAVRKVIGDKRSVPLHAPFITKADRELVDICLRDDPVGRAHVEAFEAILAHHARRKYAVAVSSGTAALHLALHLLVKSGGFVTMPTLTFVAAAAAARYHDLRISFLDSERSDLGSAVPHVGALVAWVTVHLLGIPSPRSRQNGVLIEDAAEALGSSYDGWPCGSFGDVSIFSFNANKIVTCGGGGALVTDDEGMAQAARHLATTAKKPSKWFYDHDQVGFNYRMPNVNAALGLGQLDRLSEILAVKSDLHERYAAAMREIGLDMVGSANPAARPNHWLNAVFVPPSERDVILEALDADGIGCRALFTPLHRQEPYRTKGDFPVAEALAASVICLPSGAGL